MPPVYDPDAARAEFRAGLRDITPLSLGVALYGLAFGLLAAQVGIKAPLTALMGLTVFAGSSQIVAVERLAAGAGMSVAILAGLALNLRLLLMTASLRDELAGRPLWQIMLGVHLTSDENWGLMHATRCRGGRAGYWYLVGGGTSLIAVWAGATMLGTGFAGLLPDLAAIGLDFAFTAAFILLLRNLWRGPGDLAPWALSAGTTLSVAVLLPVEPSWALIVGGLAGAALAAGRGAAHG
ncbi:AzlC family ABC transporter permease [Pseudodonghicola xiamenensis]|uniref:Branched-chain amino acid ABC transporter permease n=1 Tax=Pseudodonghicola xiamenensis TaxID=337702 RepID=A0A8J3H2S4_9RHOB|nr:AzlC family ABC transporter permease [Pseudodonghicola xiamenensis]GHG80538.1 branched-chain amino acid ABC transporter permease [Pseudodonghicola xiamenensis]